MLNIRRWSKRQKFGISLVVVLTLSTIVSYFVTSRGTWSRSDSPNTTGQMTAGSKNDADLAAFEALFSPNEPQFRRGLATIKANWHAGSTVMLVESLAFAQGLSPLQLIVRSLEKKTGQAHGMQIGSWYRWIWRNVREPHPKYAAFKKNLYSRIDPRSQSTLMIHAQQQFA